MASSSTTSVSHHRPCFSSDSSHPWNSEMTHQRSVSNIFFNSNTSISELKKISEEQDIDEIFQSWDKTQKKFIEWASNNSSPCRPSPTGSVRKVTKYPFLLTPPPGFGEVKPTIALSDLSTESEISPTVSIRSLCTVVSNDVKLQPIPNKFGLVKRENRGTFDKEELSEERTTGEIKFYQLKKRFGFISLDEDKSDIFLCEDDLVLSGINIKKFKETVFKKVQQRFSFLIKYYSEKGAIKRKVVDIRPI